MRNEMSEQDRRRRRRRRRIQVIIIYTAIAIGLAWFFESQATTTIIFVRHAEKAASPGHDPGLSPAGQQRVAELTRQLVDADVVAGVDAIYSTPFRRTQETARPIADALDLPVNTYDADDVEPILEHILRQHKGKIILVVAHSNTLPVLIAFLLFQRQIIDDTRDRCAHRELFQADFQSAYRCRRRSATISASSVGPSTP